MGGGEIPGSPTLHWLPIFLQLHEQDDILNMWVCDYVENNGRYTRWVKLVNWCLMAWRCVLSSNQWWSKFRLCMCCRWEALGQLTVALSLLGMLYGLSVLYDAPSRKPCVCIVANISMHCRLMPSIFKVERQFPFDNLYLSSGGDPNKAPTHESKLCPIKSTYGEYVS